MATIADGHLHRHRHGRNEGGGGKVVVVMVPLPAQGHLNQLLQLSHLIAAYNVPVHYACTAAHNRQARQRAHLLAGAANVHFDDLPLPEYQSPSPNPNSANKFPSHLQPLFDAVAHIRRPLAALLRSLSSTADRVVVIHDSLMSSVVQDAASIPDAESYTFHSISAFSIFLYFYEGLETPFPINEELQKLAIPSLEDCFTREFMEFIVSEQKHLDLDSGSIFNTCRKIEGEFLDSIEKISGFKCMRNWALGPFNPISINRKETDHNLHRHECLQWLDTQERNSVIFLSFGTTTSFPHDQIEELAIGLEESGVNFIWVVREADRGDCGGGGENPVPEGFEERVRERGMVVRDWAPQLEILGHSATGGFVTHCGWNSCMESLSMGKPIGAWPMHSDQPRNAVLMSEVLRVGVVVRPWAERNGVLRAAAIAGALRRLMASEEMRRRAEEVGGIVRRAAAEGGATRLEMDSFVAHITR